MEEETKYCPYCGVMIDYDMEYCPACGERQPSLTGEEEKPSKNPLLAGFLSLLVTGLGQLYLGKTWRGLGFLLGTITTGALLSLYLSIDQVMIVGAVVAIISAVDAYNLAKKT